MSEKVFRLCSLIWLMVSLTNILAYPNSINLQVKQDTVKGKTQTVVDTIIHPIKDSVGFQQDSMPQKDKTSASRQDSLLRGKIVDQEGQPIKGALVTSQKAKGVTSSNASGIFSLKSLSDDIIEIHTMTHGDTTLSIKSQNDLSIIMQSGKNRNLDEVVVIGYGTARKKDLTGAISQAKGADLANRNQISLSQSLQGTMSGVTASRNSSAAGKDAEVLVRGITSVGSNTPLYVVDGVPIGDMNDVNPKDVENVTVLKDGASAAIYGARAAAGVILITTKRGQVDQVGVEYTGNAVFSQPTTLPQYVGATRYLQMMNELSWNDAGNIEGGDYPLYTKDEVDNWEKYSQTDFNKYPVTDWEKLVLKKHATGQSHSLAITGGSQRIRSRMSINYDQMGEIYDYRDYKRVLTRLNNNFQISEAFSADLDLAYAYEYLNNPNINPGDLNANPIRSALTMAPIYAAHWADGRIADGKNGDNIYAKLQEGGFDKEWTGKLTGRVALHYQPIDGLKFSVIVSPTLYNLKKKTFSKKIPYYSADDPFLLMGYMTGFERTKLSEKRNDITNITKQFLINYTKTFGNHNVNVLLGYEDYYSKTENLTATGDYYPIDQFPYLDISPTDYRSNSGNATDNAYRSYFGRLMYDYKGKYLFQGNLRYDGSSRFHPDHRWGAFPSLSLGWVMSEEEFMADNPVFSFLKLRASWGQLGNERIGSDYPYFSTINFYSTLFYRGNEIVSDVTAAQTTYAIPDIYWETTETQDIGVDMSFLTNRLSLSFDYYKKRTFDMLLPLEIPGFVGYDNPKQNAGTMYTKGWDLSMGWEDQLKDFRYSVAINLSDSKSTMGNMAGRIVLDGNTVTREGSEFEEWYGYLSNGIYQTQDQVDQSARTSDNLKPGDLQYVDISGPEGVPDGKITPEYDRVLLGGSLPRFTYGAILNGAYKNFDVSLTFQGIGKVNKFISADMVKVVQGSAPPTLIDGEYWSHYQTAEENLNATYPRLSLSASDNNYTSSNYWLFNGAYFRLKNIAVGYTLPKTISEKLKMQSLRIFANGTDLFSIDKFPEGWDPEAAATSYISRTFNLGVSVKF